MRVIIHLASLQARLIGASDYVQYFSIRSEFVGYHDKPEVSKKPVPLAEKIEEFESALERLKLINLQMTPFIVPVKPIKLPKSVVMVISFITSSLPD